MVVSSASSMTKYPTSSCYLFFILVSLSLQSHDDNELSIKQKRAQLNVKEIPKLPIHYTEVLHTKAFPLSPCLHCLLAVPLLKSSVIMDKCDKNDNQDSTNFFMDASLGNVIELRPDATTIGNR